jgi:hypothetical protein
MAKALFPLRQNKKIGQKFLWNEDELVKGNFYVFLALLEDLRR